MAALLTSLGISIHAPREGGDMFLRRGSRHFLISIHAPREGGDLTVKRIGKIKIRFQSTPPARGATLSSRNQYMAQIISIHAPREGGDGVFYGRFAYQSGYFNPRPPRGGRPAEYP